MPLHRTSSSLELDSLPLDCRPGRISAISRWLSVATPPFVIAGMLIDPSGIALFHANVVDEPVPKRRTSLESLQDLMIVHRINPVASLRSATG